MIHKGKIIKVFISYKWEDIEHNRWVEKFASDLRRYSIDAMLDKWEVKYGESFTDYMTSAISIADVVLFIMTPKSVEAAEAPKEKGGAVKFEVQLSTARRITGESFRFIGILRKGKKVVVHLRDFKYVDFRDDEKYDVQLRSLVDDLQGIDKKPALGKPRNATSAVFKEKHRVGHEFSKYLLKAKFLPNSRDIVVWSSLTTGPDEPIKIYEFIDRKYVAKDLQRSCVIDSIQFDSKNRMVILKNQDYIHILDTDLKSVGNSLPIYKVGEPTIRSIAIHEEKPLIAIGTDYGSILVWNYELDNILWNKQFFPRDEIIWITKLAYKYDSGEILFFVNNCLFFVDISSGEISNKLKIGNLKESMNFAFSNKSGLIALAGVTKVSVYELSTKPIHRYDSLIDYPYVDSIEFDSSGDLISIISGTPMTYKSVIIVNAKKGETLFSLDSSDIYEGNIESASFSSDSKSIAISKSIEIVIYEKD